MTIVGVAEELTVGSGEDVTAVAGTVPSVCVGLEAGVGVPVITGITGVMAVGVDVPSKPKRTAGGMSGGWNRE
jgi:hypothetical protein